MQIKDITVEAQDLATVRGGNTNVNSFIGGNATAAVSVGGAHSRAIHSPTDVSVANLAANEVVQSASIVDRDVYSKHFSITDSIFELGRSQRKRRLVR